MLHNRQLNNRINRHHCNFVSSQWFQSNYLNRADHEAICNVSRCGYILSVGTLILDMAPKNDDEDSRSASFKKLYLVLYNSSLAIAWSLVMLKSCIYVTEKKSFKGLYMEVEFWLKVAQTAAVMEVLHAAFGLVRSSVAVTAPQIASRVGILWVVLDGLVMKNASAENTLGFPALLFAWTITEIIRYTFYTNILMDNVAPVLQWCRYTFFLVLYPMGVTGEIMCIFASFPVEKNTGTFSVTMPNVLNMSFDYVSFCYIVLSLYGPVFYFLYTHMLAQRSKVLGKKEKSS